MSISKKYSKKLGKLLWRGLFSESCGITYHRFLNVKYNKGPLLEIIQRCFTALKYKKALTALLKENLHSKQLRLNYINSQKRQTEIIFLDWQ